MEFQASGWITFKVEDEIIKKMIKDTINSKMSNKMTEEEILDYIIDDIYDKFIDWKLGQGLLPGHFVDDNLELEY